MSYIRIGKHYLHLAYLVLGAFEFLFLFASFFIVQNIQYKLQLLPVHPLPFGMFMPFLYALILSCGSLAMGVYIALMREGFLSMFFRTLVAYCFLGAFSLILIGTLWPQLDIGSTNLFWVIMASTGMVLVARKVFSEIVDSDQLTTKTVVLGTGSSAKQLQRAYSENQKSLSIRIVGYIETEGSDIDKQLVIPAPSDWLSFCRNNRISEIIIAQQERRKCEGSEFPMEQLVACKMAGIEIINVQSFYERELNRVDLDTLRPSWLLFADGFYVSQYRNLMKRAFDIVVSLLLGLILLPVVMVVALFVFIETGRPIFYSQIRVGKGGKHFKIYKIRSMVIDAEKSGEAIWASENDARVTKVGAFIRNTRLDEIPQLWNVIRGDMSFVGPRPERPEFVDSLNEKIPFYSHRHAIKPGLMGWAQLHYSYGSSVTDAKNKLEYDLYYTKNHSIVMDLLIMIQTVEIVLLGKGVH